MIETSPVTFSEGAIAELKRLMNEPGFDHSQALRVGVKGGGCSGLSYVLGFDSKQADDVDFTIEGRCSNLCNVCMSCAFGVRHILVEWYGIRRSIHW